MVAPVAASTAAASETSAATWCTVPCDDSSPLTAAVSDRIAVPQRHGGPGCQQPLGNRAADALAAAGDDRTLTLQVDLIHGRSW